MSRARTTTTGKERNAPKKTQIFTRVFATMRSFFRPSWVVAIFVLVTIYYLSVSSSASRPHFQRPIPIPIPKLGVDSPELKYDWNARRQNNPVQSFITLPTNHAVQIPEIQFRFEIAKGALRKSPHEQVKEKQNAAHLNAVKTAFLRTWQGYRNHAWGRDFLLPVAGEGRSGFGRFAVTLVESLDTMFLLDLKAEFEEALEVVEALDFSRSEEELVEIFEVSIRVLGGLLAAYDLSGRTVLLEKAVEAGDFLYGAFDTGNRMPITRWDWKRAKKEEAQEAFDDMLLAEIGSMTLEFTRLTQLTGDPKFFDAVQRVSKMLELHQDRTQLPGLWPMVMDATKEGKFDVHNAFTLGSMVDSTYEILPKQYLQLSGRDPSTKKMYEKAITTAQKHNFFKPMTKTNSEILISALTRVSSPGNATVIDPQVQTLSCYVGGMVALGSKIFSRPDDLRVAKKLVDGCIWASEILPSGLMPEAFYVIPCEDVKRANGTEGCRWDERLWKDAVMNRKENVTLKNFDTRVEEMRLQPGIVDVTDARFLLRPEIIESLFILYRITGESSLRATAWKLFESIERQTRTEHGNSALKDVTDPNEKADSMESYWTGATLKYFLLLFSEPSVVTLDEWVFNTGGHPFKRPK